MDWRLRVRHLTWRNALLFLLALLLASVLLRQFQTFYFWGDHDCMARAYNGTYAVAPQFCNADDAAARARERR
jgi:hypothetical protein